MSNNRKSIKDRVSIRKDDRPTYKLIRVSDGDLKGISAIELFLITMMLGYYSHGKEGLKQQFSDANDGYVKISDFNNNAWAIIKSIAVAEDKNMEVLLDINRMFDIAENYATLGIAELKEMYFENEHNFLRRMEELLIDVYEDPRTFK